MFGRSIPADLNSEFSPLATPIPARMPRPAPIAPITSASISTEVRTWRRDAPSVRSIPNSRVRWATVIENVLKIVNAPDEERDPGEDQERDLEEAEVVLDVVGLLLRVLLAGAHLDAWRA